MVSSKGNKLVGFFALFLFTLMLCLGGDNFTSEAAIPQKNMSIEYKSGKISAVLKGVQTREVLEDIAQNTGIEFVGLDEVTGTIEELEFNDLSLEEAIRTLGENSILIFRKEGPQGEEMKIKKVIFLAQKEEEPQEPSIPSPPKPVIPPEPTPPPTPPVRPTPPSRPTPPTRPTTPTPTPRPTPPTRPSRPTPPTTPKPTAKPTVTPAPPPAVPKPEPVPPKKPKPAPVRPKPVSEPKIQDANLKRGLKYYKEKRWDRTIKYLNIYLESHPEDEETQQKIAQAYKNTKEAIRLYNSGKNAEKAANYEEAYKHYNNAYKLYPLLYDSWEKMREMKKKLK